MHAPLSRPGLVVRIPSARRPDFALAHIEALGLVEMQVQRGSLRVRFALALSGSEVSRAHEDTIVY
jgi:hypothetical protein